MRKGLTGLAVLAALAMAGPAAAKIGVEVGKPAPDFSMTTFDGKVVHLKDLRGQVILVNFWATWCGPCKVELPLIDTYYKVQKAHGLAAVAVTTEDSVPAENLTRLAKAMTIPLAWRFHGKPYVESNELPTNYVIDRHGIVRYAEAGAFTLDKLNEVLVPLLSEPVPDDAQPVIPAKAAAR